MNIVELAETKLPDPATVLGMHYKVPVIPQPSVIIENRCSMPKLGTAHWYEVEFEKVPIIGTSRYRWQYIKVVKL